MYYTVSTLVQHQEQTGESNSTYKNKLESQTLHTRTNKTNKTNETTRTKQTIIKHAISLQGSRACQVSTYHTDQRATIIILAGVALFRFGQT